MDPTGIAPSDVGLRFKGLGKKNPRFGEVVYKLIGFKAELDGNDWVVPASDPIYRQGPRDFLTLHGQIEFGEGDFEDIAVRLVSLIPSAFDKRREEDRERVRVEIDESSKLHYLYGLLVQLVHLQRDEVARFLKEKILPFMADEMEAQRVTPISIDPAYFQGIFTLIKFALLLSEHDSAKVEELVFKRRAFNGILPSVFSPLTYIETLTRLAPYAMTLPIDRDGCSWHFQSEAMWVFSHIHTEGLFHQFMNDLNPVGEEVSMLGFSGIQNMSENNIWKYLRILVHKMNGLLRYIYDPKTFVDPETRTINFGMQIQAIGCLDLLFADILSSNYSTSSYHRQNSSMAALDKLANLKRHLGGINRTEGTIFRGLATTRQRDHIVSIFEKATLPHGNEIRDGLVRMTEETFERIYEHYREDLGDKDATEDVITERLWHQRNLKHGTFLSREQFKKLFHRARGTVPKDLITLPFLLTLALVFEPKEFLQFDPES